MNDLLTALKTATVKRDRAEARLREANEQIDTLLLRARDEGIVPDAARVLGINRDSAWHRARRVEERRNGANG